MHLRHLHYLVMLARERHFGRAAEACFVTQSTLSAAIKALEDEIGAPVVVRDKRFHDFTPEGLVLLDWARQVLADRSLLDQRVRLLKKGLSGRLRLGVIPAAMPTIALLTTPFSKAHPDVSFVIRASASSAILHGLDEFDLDAGVVYLDHEPLHGLRSLPLYAEQYILLTPADERFAGRRQVSWRDVAELPLCLLTQDMQNRRLLDAIFEEEGLAPSPSVEANTVTAMCSHIRAGGWSSVLPHSFLWLFGVPPGTQALAIEPRHANRIGIVLRDRAPTPLLVALETVAKSLRLQETLDAALGDAALGDGTLGA